MENPHKEVDWGEDVGRERVSYNAEVETMEEKWVSIKGYEGKYEISNTGKVKSLARMVKKFNTTKMQEERLLSVGKDGCVTLANGPQITARRIKVAKLVSEHFPE